MGLGALKKSQCSVAVHSLSKKATSENNKNK